MIIIIVVAPLASEGVEYTASEGATAAPEIRARDGGALLVVAILVIFTTAADHVHGGGREHARAAVAAERRGGAEGALEVGVGEGEGFLVALQAAVALDGHLCS